MKFIIPFITSAVSFLPIAAFAEPSSIQIKGDVHRSSLQEEVDALKEKVAKLESDKSSGGPSIQVSGFVNFSYNYNTNSPDNRTSVGRVFDKETNQFTLNAAKLTIQSAVSDDQPFGARVDLYAGEDAKVIHSAGLGEADDTFDLEQAFLNYHKGSWDVKAGKFVTLAGAEVIESKDNWNTSRSLLFGYAIPFTHTGVRTTYTTESGWDFVLGVNNGWDVANDNNSGKTVEARVGMTGLQVSTDSTLNVGWNGYFGPENADSSTQRALSDVVIVFKTPWSPLTLMYNYDYARDEDTASWWGHAGYARIDLAQDWSASLRGEYFDDGDGARLGTVGATYREFTGTLEYRPAKNVTARLEYRSDWSSDDVFSDDTDSAKDTQSTVSGEVIVSF